MKKNTIKTALFIALLSMAGHSVNAQNKELKVGTNPTIKQPSAVLEVESANKGMLMPRVTLTSVTDVTTIPVPANALTVFNTATAGTAPNNVTPGYYYWSTPQNKWIKLLNQNEVPEPWQVQTTTDKATTNAQNIYQTGSVAIGKNAVQTGVALDVAGAVRGGMEHLGTVGENSVAFGFQNISSHFYSAVGGGNLNTASGLSSVVSGGGNNIASGGNTVVAGGGANIASALVATVSGGQSNTASAQGATVSGGQSNFATAQYSTVSGGYDNYARSMGEWVGGLHTTDYTPYSVNGIDGRDRLFNIGRGFSLGNDLDAFTILKNGKTGIGFNNFETTTFGELLQVNGNARFATLPSETGNIATDRVVVADATGVLKTVTVADIATPETNTTLSIAAGELVYANEQANNVNVNLISADADNALIAGTDGRLFAPTAENIYTTDGTLTSERTVTLDSKPLHILGDHQRTTWSLYSGIIQEGLDSSPYDEASITLLASDKDDDGFRGRLDLQAFAEGDIQIYAGAEATSLIIGTHVTIEPAPIVFATSSGGGALATNKAIITGTGEIGIATDSPSEKLDIGEGNVRVRDIVSNIGAETDRIVVADVDGILKTVAAPTTTAIRTETADYTALSTDETILVNAAGGTVTVTLPSAPTVGKKYNVKKVDSTANTVTVNGNGHSIDGTVTISGTLPYQGWVMQYDGSNWFIISRI